MSLDTRVKKLFWFAAVPAKVFTALMIGAHYHADILRAEQNILFGKQKTEYEFFQDPYGLSLDITLNSKGNREVYLSHKESGYRVGIGRDLAPVNPNVLIEALKNRINERYQAQIHNPINKTYQNSETK